MVVTNNTILACSGYSERLKTPIAKIILPVIIVIVDAGMNSRLLYILSANKYFNIMVEHINKKPIESMYLGIVRTGNACIKAIKVIIIALVPISINA